MRAGSRAERAGSMSRCALRKTNVRAQLGKGLPHPSGNQLLHPSPRQGGSLGWDCYHPRVGQEKPSHPFAPFQHLSIGAGGEAVRGSIPAGREGGEGEAELTQECAACSAICSWPSHGAGGKGTASGQSFPARSFSGTIFRIFLGGGRRGVLLVVTRTKTCDSKSSIPPGHGIM